MKNLKKIMAFIIVAMCFTFVTACIVDTPVEKVVVKFDTAGGTTIADQEIEKNTVVVKPQDPEKTGSIFMGWYVDNTYTTEFDFTAPISVNTTIYALWDGEEEVFVNGVNQKNEFVLFTSNKQEKENKRTEFKDLTVPYLVGDDNNFEFKPNVSFIKVDLSTMTVVDDNVKPASWEYDVKFYLVEEAQETLLAETNEYVEKVDKVNCTVDFSETAIDKQFKVEVSPKGLTEKQQQNIATYTTSFTFKVVDGFNLYNALDLAYIESRKVNAYWNAGVMEAWAAFKQEKGLDLNYRPAAMIMHKNISVKTEDIPTRFFWTKEEVKGASDEARAEGSLKDFVNIYQRDLNENEEFKFEGNYFTLSAEELPVVVRERDKITEEGGVISHATLIRFEGASSGKSIIENVNLIGNAPRVEDATKSGGLIFIKIEGPEFHGYNNISTSWFIAYFPTNSLQPALIEKVRAYDAYNCFVYSWGCDKVYIKDSELIGAGGPVIIQEHVNPGKENSQLAKVFVTNSVLESYVTGTEGWFKGVNATALVPQIKAADKVFNPFGRSFLKINADKSLTYLNLICVNLSAAAGDELAPCVIEGEVKLDDRASLDFGAQNPYLKAIIDTVRPTASVAFQTTAGGFGYATQKGVCDHTQQVIMDPTNAIYQGDYLGIYAMGNLIVVGFNSFNPTNGTYELYTPSN